MGPQGDTGPQGETGPTGPQGDTGPAATAEPTYDTWKGIRLNKLGTYDSGETFESAAEIVSYDPLTERAFMVNAMSASVDVLDISTPSAPAKIETIEASSMGAGVNSIDVHGGVLAVAVEGEEVDSPGTGHSSIQAPWSCWARPQRAYCRT